MIPIHQLLSRIRWDPKFGRSRFEIAYVDHSKKRLVRLPLERIAARAGERFAFQAVEDDGSVHSVPYHRVRAVWRDGRLIWSRAGFRARARR